MFCQHERNFRARTLTFTSIQTYDKHFNRFNSPSISFKMLERDITFILRSQLTIIFSGPIHMPILQTVCPPFTDAWRENRKNKCPYHLFVVSSNKWQTSMIFDILSRMVFNSEQKQRHNLHFFCSLIWINCWLWYKLTNKDTPLPRNQGNIRLIPFFFLFQQTNSSEKWENDIRLNWHIVRASHQENIYVVISEYARSNLKYFKRYESA